MAIQNFEHMYSRHFRSVPATTAIFQTRQFLLLSSINFLVLLDYKASSHSTSTLELLPQDLDRFRTLKKANKEFLKLSQKRGKQPDDED
jgi:hypothetical protein